MPFSIYSERAVFYKNICAKTIDLSGIKCYYSLAHQSNPGDFNMDNISKINEKDEYRFSRILYIMECMFEYFISILTSGAYLAKLTTTIGISDAMTAILASIASLAGMFQIVSIFLAHKTPVKRWVLPVTFVTQSLVSTLYIIPFLNIKNKKLF